MKKTSTAHRNIVANKLPFRAEIIRVLTERELTLVAAGNCVNSSDVSQTGTNPLTTCS